MRGRGGGRGAGRHGSLGGSLLTGVAVLAVLLAVSAPAQALPRDPIQPPDDLDIPFVAPDGFDWSVPSRFGARHLGLPDFHWNQATGPLRWGTEADRETYDPSYVHPDEFPMDFDACATPEDRDAVEAGLPTAGTYEWLVDGTVYAASHTCELRHTFAAQGTYDVSLTVRDDGGAVVGSYDRQVYIKDFLIVSIGDSYASGEGNPDIPQRVGVGGHYFTVLSEARWVDRRCHRSANAASAQAARTLEAVDRKTSVTFLSFACSGATINRESFGAGNPLDPYEPPPNDPGVDPKPKGSGVLGPYRGPEPPAPDRYDDHLPSQIDQLKAAVGDRRIDALTISAGGNDIGFGPIATVCVLFGDCANHPVRGVDTNLYRLHVRFEHDRLAMPERYKALNAALNDPANGFDIAETFITEYADPTRDETGAQCQVMLEDVIKPLFWGAVPFHIIGDEVDFAAGPVLNGLNGAVRSAADKYGWTFVDGIAEAFDRYGYIDWRQVEGDVERMRQRSSRHRRQGT